MDFQGIKINSESITLPVKHIAVLVGIRYVAFPLLRTIYNSVNKCFKKRKFIKLSEQINLEKKNDLKTFISSHSHEVSEEKMSTIRNATALELANSIKKKLLSSYEVVLTYCLLAATKGVENNWIAHLTTEMLENSLEDAREHDKLLQTTDISTLPPFFGVPLSCKDAIGVKGHINSIGTFSNYNLSKKIGVDKDSVFVTHCRSLGFIPFCQTVGPQGFQTQDSGSYLWGPCGAALNSNKSAGGSSSGEGGMLGSRLSPAGIGNDIGGSLRVPAAINGLYTLKSTSNRMSIKGKKSYYHLSTESWNDQIKSVNGFIARSMEDLQVFYANTFGRLGADYKVNNKSFDHESYNSKKSLKIAVLPPIFNLKYSKAVQNAVDRTVEHLSQTHTVVDFPVEKANEMFMKGIQIYNDNDNIPRLVKALGEEPPYSYFERLLTIKNFPDWFKPALPYLLRATGNWRAAEFSKQGKNSTKEEFLDHIWEFNTAKSSFIEFCIEQKIDAIVCPTLYIPSWTKGEIGEVALYCYVSMLFNMLDLPSGNVPVKRVEESENIYEDEVKDLLTKGATKESKESIGMPVGILVSGLPNEDETVLRLMKEIDAKFNYGEKFNFN